MAATCFEELDKGIDSAHVWNAQAVRLRHAERVAEDGFDLHGAFVFEMSFCFSAQLWAVLRVFFIYEFFDFVECDKIE